MKTFLQNSKTLSTTLLLLCLFFVSIGKSQTTLFQYNFTAGNSPSTDNAVGTPSISTIGTISGTLTSGCTGNGYSGQGWDAGDAFRFTVNTTGFTAMVFSYNESSSSTQINNFLVQVSTDAVNWTEVRASYTPAAGCTGSGNITIPVEFSNQPVVYIEINKVDAPNGATRTYRIDDATLTGFAITNYYSKATGNLNSTATWGTNTNGSGTAPSNFTTGGSVFNIRNNATPTIAAAWTVSGSGAKVIVGDGTNACNFTVPSGSAFTGNVDVSAAATLTLTNTTIPTLGALDATSTVVYNATAAQAISAVTYGNLIYSGSSTATAAGSFDVAGTFTCSAGSVTLNSTATARTFNIGGSFIMSSTGTIECGSSSGTSNINIAGNFSKTAGYIVTNGSAANATITFNGTTQNIQSNGGTDVKWINFVIPTGSTCTFNGAFNMNASGTAASFIVNSGGTLFCGTNNLVSGTGCTFTLGAGATLGVGSTAGITTSGATGNIQTNTRTYTAGANYIYNGSAAQVTGNGLTANTPNDLTINNSAGVTLSAATTISGDLLISSGTLNANNLNMSVGGSWTNNGGFTAGTGTETFTGATQTIGGTSSTTFGIFTIASGASYTMNTSNTAASLTFTAAGANSSLSHASSTTFTVNGAITINQPTGSFTSAWNINAATATVSGLITFAGTNTTTTRVGKIVITTGTLNANGGITFVGSAALTKVIDMSGGAGNLNLKGALTVPSLSSTLTPGTSSTFSYVDTAPQTINNFTSGNYYNLAVSGSSVKTFAAVSTITNNLSITSPATVTFPNTTNSTANSLTLGGTSQFSGTWGGTGSGATFINTTYFNPTTNGKITISTGGCPSGYWIGGTSTAWNTAANWCGSVLPTATTDVVIPNGTAFAPSITAITAACKSITIDSGATLTLTASGSSILNVSGDFTNNGTLTAGAASNVNLVGSTAEVIGGTSTTTFSNLTINTATAPVTVTNSTAAFAVSGNLTVTKGNLTLQATDNSYNVTGDLSVASTGTLTHNVDWATGKQMTVAGNVAIDGVYSKGAAPRSHLQMTGAGKTIHTGTSSLNILTLLGTVTANGALTVDDNFWAPFGSGSFTTGANTITANSGILVSGGTMTINGGTVNVTNGLNIGQAATSGTVTMSSGSLTTDGVTLGDAAGTTANTLTQSGGSFTVNGPVTINQPLTNSTTNTWNINAQTATVSGLITFAGTDATASRVGKIVITTGTLNANGGITFVGSNAATKVIDMSGGAGNLNLKGALTVPAASSTLTPGTSSTFSYVDAGTQTINKFSAGNYYNLALSGAGVKTFSAATAITNNLSIATGSSANLGTFSHTAASLTMGGFGTPNGTHGSTTSSATNKNNTFFAATTGIVTVGTNTCAAISAVISGTTSICNGGSTNLAVTVTGGLSTYNVVYSAGTVNPYTSGAAISVSPSSTTAYTLTSVKDTNGCPATTSGTATVTVNPNVTASVSITASPSATICSGTNVTFTATPTNGGTPTYQWKLNGTNVGTNSATYSNNALTNSDAVTVEMTSTAPCVSGSPATSNTVTMTVNPNLPASVSIAASPSSTICSGTNVTFTATPTNGGTPTYQWKLNGTNVGTNSATYSNNALANSDAVTVVMTSTATCATGSPATSNTVTMTVNPNLPASVSIAASPSSTICSGTNVTFTATPTNGGTPTYQWKLNGTNVGTNSATYSNNALANGNTVTVTMTSTATCATGSPATSNTVTMTVNPNLPASVSIAASPSSTICSGTNVTFTATPTNGGTPTYQWKLNGTNVGTNSATYSNNTLANSDAVTVVMTSTATCATGSPATSNTVTMTVNPNLPASVSIAASPSSTICSGTNVTFTATPTNGGTPTYQWKLNGTNVGTNSATYSNNTLANSDAVTVLMTSTATCATGSPATSNTVTMTVNPNLPASVSIAASPSSTICSGTNVTFTATPTNGGTPTYQWKLNGTNVGTNSATYSNNALANSDAVTVVMTSTATCATGSPATSNTVTMTVNPNLPASVSIAASPSSTICSGTNVTFTATPTNGGTPTYQWKLNGNNVGINSATYSNNALANSDVVTVLMTSTATCATGSPATSNTVTMTVNPNLPASVAIAASPSSTICSGTNVTFTATPTNGGTPTYQWKLNGTNVGTNSATYSNNALANSDVVTVLMTSTATCATGSPATSNTVTMTVNGTSTAAIISGTASICAGTPTNLQVAITGGTSPYTVIYTDGTSNFTASSYTSGSNIVVSPTSTTTYTLVSVTSTGGCAGSGNTGSAVVTIDSTTSTDGGITWSNGNPSGTKSIIFDGSTGTIGADLTACSLKLTNNATVTVSSGFSVTLNGKITVDSGSTFTLNNNANLLQNSTLANSGNIVVKRNSAALKRLDYTLWSTPVTGQELYSFSPLTFANRFYTYNPSSDLYVAYSGFNVTGLNSDGVNGTDSNHTQFSTGTGYLIRMPWNHPTAPTIFAGTFTGVPNNGNVTLSSLTSGLYYAIGNPYPSTIDADQFIIDNSIGDNPSTPGDGLYFWRKTNNAAAASYATYTTAGGVKSGGDTLNIVPNGVIQVGEGFIVKSTSTSIGFNNNQRVANNGDQFLRTSNIVERNRIWLNLSDATTNINQMMVSYMTGATQDIDAAIDGRFFKDSPTALNSLLNNEEFAIQGRSLPFADTDVVPLAFKAATAGNYTIAIDHVDGLFTGGAQTVYLKDNLNNTYNNLNTGSYAFATTAGVFNDRFEIVYQNQLANPTFTANTVVIYSQNNGFVINSGNFMMSSVKVFDIRGRLIEEKTGINANQTNIKGGLANEVLLVQVTSDEGTVITKKVIK